MSESWQAQLRKQAMASDERRAGQEPSWTIHATNPPTFSQVWAVRYTRQLYEAGVHVAEDLSLMATVYEAHIIADFRTCEDGIHALCEFLPPVESLTVRPERMSGVVAALKRSGYHAWCHDGHGKRYEF